MVNISIAYKVVGENIRGITVKIIIHKNTNNIIIYTINSDLLETKDQCVPCTGNKLLYVQVFFRLFHFFQIARILITPYMITIYHVWVSKGIV